MGLVELGSASAVQSFLETSSNNSNVVAAVVTFSAHWCGPCRNSKPALEELAVKQNSAHNGNVKMGIVYEDTLGDAIHSYKIRAFPTHVLYIRGIEEQRVEGANVLAIEAMIQAAILKHNISSTSMPMTGGSTLGGGGSTAATASEAREARLAKLAVSNVTATATRLDPMIEDAAAAAVAADAADVKIEQTIDELDADIEMEDVAKDSDVPTPTSTVEDPTAKINQEFVQMLTEDMGFSLLRAQKGLIFGNGGTVDGAVEWLTEHQDDIDIDEDNIINQFAATAMSYKCNECGCILSNMANLELHANKTGHSDFEESTHRVEPLTEEQKTAKIAEIKQLLKLKRTEREEAEKVDDVEREIQRRMMGKEMAKTKEQLDTEQRKREAYLRKKEKTEFNKERQRLREELARDKAERASHKGKLSSRLGVDGYKPDGIQYDVPGSEDSGQPIAVVESAEGNGEIDHKPKKAKADFTRIDEFIGKVSSYRAGGDGGKCLKILKTYVENVVDNPLDVKFRTINTENKVYKTKVKPFVGAKSLLLVCGFDPSDNGESLELKTDADLNVLAEIKTKLEAAMIQYG